MWDWSLEPTASLYHTANALEPLHVQFDYLKNTVSVVNDYYKELKGYTVSAAIYNLNSRKVVEVESAAVNLLPDAVANDVLTLAFPKDITQVHFIKLRLKDEKGKEVSSNFYWRSNDTYEGKKTLTGPATSGFEDLNKLAKTQIRVKYQTKVENGRHFIDLELKNTGRSISFFTQLQWLDKDKSPVRPSFYTDNFMSLLPGESTRITIETGLESLRQGEAYTLTVKGFNVKDQQFTIKL
jgi:hypothetical protein